MYNTENNNYLFVPCERVLALVANPIHTPESTVRHHRTLKRSRLGLERFHLHKYHGSIT